MSGEGRVSDRDSCFLDKLFRALDMLFVGSILVRFSGGTVAESRGLFLGSDICLSRRGDGGRGGRLCLMECKAC